MHNKPRIAVIDNNILSMTALKAILSDAMPMAEIDCFLSFDEFEGNNPNGYFHFFVTLNIIIDHRSFFIENKRKTIVLTSSSTNQAYLSDFNCLHTDVNEKHFIKSLISLEQKAHANGRNLPETKRLTNDRTLTDRETEILVLIVKGLINKEIASKLNIGTSTVITHRHNIMEKVGTKSVAGLTAFAVMNGYISISQI